MTKLGLIYRFIDEQEESQQWESEFLGDELVSKSIFSIVQVAVTSKAWS